MKTCQRDTLNYNRGKRTKTPQLHNVAPSVQMCYVSLTKALPTDHKYFKYYCVHYISSPSSKMLLFTELLCLLHTVYTQVFIVYIYSLV